MKQKLTLLFLTLFTLTACTSNATEKEESASSSVESEEVAESTETTEESSAESTSEAPSEEPVAYAYTVNPDIFTIEPIEDASSEVALLTFDDAPQEHSLAIAETVKDKGANAIFFVMGQFLEDPANKEIIKQIHEMGFEIGNHSYSHPVLPDLSYEEQLEELIKTNDLVEEATGERPRFFRAPHGMYDDNVLAILEEEGMVNMNWTYGYDWEEQYMDGAALADIMVNTEFLGNGANLLMHDRPWTEEAISSIIDGLRAKGYELVDPTMIESPNREVQ
ncbi:polysaccharide deacetylase family protein [Jeotgalibaca caeni]|uniref:polysaccharide deacetylase family protein n=1 Tax=Jeotgalibaca caeni TaxID=3028623 RepID=UPI00237D7157|nr:polysaccharide deacetylase family protein [Jeotgalibaca caeni]MDE1548788.1 polysaccharide deacetylase family protein [Jeotgalibaca caeni]